MKNILKTYKSGVSTGTNLSRRFPLVSSAKIPPRINALREKKAQAALSMRPAAAITGTRPDPSTIGVSVTGFTENRDRKNLMLRGLETANTACGAAYLEVRETYVATGWKWVSHMEDSDRRDRIQALVKATLDAASGQFDNFAKLVATLDYCVATQGDAGLWTGLQDEPQSPTHGQLFFLPVFSDEIGSFYAQAQATKVLLNDWMLNYYSGVFFDSVGNNIAFEYRKRTGENSWSNTPEIILSKDFVFLCNSKRAEKRGIPAFAPGWREVWDDDQISQLTLARIKAASNRAIVTTNGRGMDSEEGLEFEGEEEGQLKQPIRKDVEGTYDFFQLTGEGTEIFNVSGGDKENLAIQEFTLRKFCNSLGFTYEFIINPNESGGAATRLASSRDSGMILKLRENLKPALDKIAKIALNYLLSRGEISPKEAQGEFVCYKPLPVIDAGYDAKATKEAIRDGLEDQPTVIAENGKDFRKVLANQAAFVMEAMVAADRANKQLVSMGLPPCMSWQMLAAPSSTPDFTQGIPIYPDAPETKPSEPVPGSFPP